MQLFIKRKIKLSYSFKSIKLKSNSNSGRHGIQPYNSPNAFEIKISNRHRSGSEWRRSHYEVLAKNSQKS